jgi:hypothetical protein
VARLVMGQGFTRVRPLAGGLDAWIDAGFELEDEALVAVRAADVG